MPHCEEVIKKQIIQNVMRFRGREAGSWAAQTVNCSQKAEILLHCCGIRTASIDGDGLIAPLMCFSVFSCKHTLGSIHLATSPSITQREEGDKRTVISVKANKIRPNLIRPYGQNPDFERRRKGRGRML